MILKRTESEARVPLRRGLIAVLFLFSAITVVSLDAATNGVRPMGVSPDALGLGGATVSLFGNSFSFFGNPASLNQKNKTYDVAIFASLAKSDNLGIGIADSYTANVSAALEVVGLAPHGETNLNELNSGVNAGLQIGYLIAKRLSVGGGVRLYHGAPYGGTNYFVGFTPGVILNLEPFSIGVAWQDIFTLNEGGFPSVLSFGASFSKNPVLFSVQGDYQIGKPNFPDNILTLRGGASFTFPKYVSLLGGFHTEYYPAKTGLDNHTASIGIEYFVAYHRLTLSDEFNFSKSENTVSFSYRFTPKFYDSVLPDRSAGANARTNSEKKN